jgi:hypothetical protein
MRVHGTQECDVHLIAVNIHYKNYFGLEFQGGYSCICIQQEEESFYQHIGLKFEEETSKMLHLEHGFVWC